jgi:methylenetetrahydrofolate dehydrogenase (NADP+)/methenyltetrahydrofolate cyclohydrolase
MDGAALAARVRQEVKEEIADVGRVGLTTILVGDDPSSEVYIRNKHRAAVEVGIEATDLRLPT